MAYIPPQFELTDDLDGVHKLRQTIERELPEFAKAIKTEVDHQYWSYHDRRR
jgi:hypothetical protein